MLWAHIPTWQLPVQYTMNALVLVTVHSSIYILLNLAFWVHISQIAISALGIHNTEYIETHTQSVLAI